MLLGPSRALDDEEGDTKLIRFGIIKDNDLVKLKPSCLNIETPTKSIYCTNADPFYDTLQIITTFVTNEGCKVEGCHIEFQNKEMKDNNSVLYGLNIGDSSTLVFLK